MSIEWNGEGLPPVGCECEAKIPVKNVWGWRRVKVVHTGNPASEKEALVFDVESTYPAWVDEFRPIRTEAERKREEVLADLAESLGHAHGLFDLLAIYNSIQSGKVRHITLK